MTKMKPMVAAAFVCAVTLIAGDGSALAGTASNNLAVSATVSNNCAITAGTLSFGAYDALNVNATADLDQTGSFTITCTKGTPYAVSLDAGSNPTHAAGTSRAMANGSNYLSYEIYKDSARTTVWNTAQTVTGTATSKGAAISLTAYGRIPQGQDAAQGAYADTVVETVTF
jgi:spore coat protein U-like protein